MKLDTERMTPGEIEENLRRQAKLKHTIYHALLEERWAKAKQLAKEVLALEEQLARHYEQARKFRPSE